MYIEFKNNKIKKICNNFDKAKAKYNLKVANNLIKRLNEIRASDNFKIFRSLKIHRCHKLSGEYEGKFAVDLNYQFRLIFSIIIDSNFDNTDYEKVLGVIVEEVIDYHD